MDEHKHFPREALRHAGELGLGGIYVREDVGGSALSRTDAVAIVEELAKADPAVAAFITIHNMVAWMIDTYGNRRAAPRVAPEPHGDDRLRQLLPHRARCGSDAAAITTSAIKDADHYVLTGVKQFISAEARRRSTS